MVGPTRQGVDAIYAKDPNAWWDAGHQNYDGTMGNYFDSAYNRSPRHRAVPVFDIENYMSGHRTGRGEVYIVGFVGMFVEGMVGNDVMGYMTTFDFAPSAGNFTADTSSFLRTVILVR